MEPLTGETLPEPTHEPVVEGTIVAEFSPAVETAERPGFTRKLSSFLFGEQEEETEQPPPLPTRRTEPEPEADSEAWKAHCRNVVAMVEGTVVDETAPVEPVMTGEVVRVEASSEQPPRRRWFSRAEPEPEPAAPKADEMYNRIATWYNEPKNAALRARWGAYPDPGEFQTWPGFVAVTNAFLDREAG